MSFVIKKTNTFKEKINLMLPTDKPGVSEKADFIAEFKVITLDQLETIQDENTENFNRVLLDEVLVSVNGIMDESGNEISGDDALDMVKNHIQACMAAASKYVEVQMSTKNGARRKNSRR